MANVVEEKSFDFAVGVVRLSNTIRSKHGEYQLSKQLIRSGTAIGANVTEALSAFSSKEFASKMAVASKEARETGYWLKLLHATNYISNEEFELYGQQVTELFKILTSIVKTTQEKKQRFNKFKQALNIKH